MATLLPASLLSQNHARNWYFGENAGLDFSKSYPMPVADGKVNTLEGVASISDSLGNLKFYTDGVTVWNFNHDIIADGLAGHNSSTMSSTIVRNRMNPDQYFLFTMNVVATTSEGPVAPEGGHYYLLDFSSANPNGAIIADYSSMGTGPIQANSVEKFLAVPFSESIIADSLNNPGYWLLTHEFDKFTFKVSQFDEKILGDTLINVGLQHANDPPNDFGANRGAIGYMATSLQGDKIAIAIEGQKVIEVFNFDNETGELRSRIQLPCGDAGHKKEKIVGSYGLAFSPAGRFLYGTSRDGGILYQWDFQTPNIIQEVNILRNNPEIPCGALQLAPNGKIYLAINGQDYLGVINRPDRYGKRAYYDEFGVRLINTETDEGGKSTYGLPQFDMSEYQYEHFGYDHNCFGDTTILFTTGSPVAGGYAPSTRFTIIDQASGIPLAILDPEDYLMDKYVFPAPGKYDVRLETRYRNKPVDTIYEIIIHEPPEVKLAEDYTVMCRGDSVVLDAGYGAFYEWADETFRDRRYTVTDEDFIAVPLQEFRVMVMDYRGCVGWDTVYVEIKSPPTVVFEYTNSVCGEPTGSATVLPSGKVENYYYTWEDFPENTTNKIENVLAGEYVVYVESRFAGCKAAKVAVVPELGGADVMIVASVDSMVCPNTEITLTVEGKGASEFNWLNPLGEHTGTVVVMPYETTTYEVEVTARDGDDVCTIVKSYTVNVSENFALELGDDLTACEGDTVEFEVEDIYEYYFWSNLDRDHAISITESSSLILLTLDSNGCSYQDDIVITFNEYPEVNLGADRSYCATDPIILTGGSGDNYSWSTGETTPEISVGKSGIYSLTLTEFGCQSHDTVAISLLNPDSLMFNSISATDIKCFNADNGQIEIDVQGMGRNYSYSIDNGLTYHENDGLFNDLGKGTYQIMVIEDSVCYKSYDTEVNIGEPEEITFNFQMASPSCEECLDGSIVLTDLKGGIGPYDIQWGMISSGKRISGLDVGYYTVIIKDSNDCEKTDQVYLDMGFRIPNAFTPNGDMINDTFTIKILDSYKQTIVKIFDANGRLVFESEEGYPEPWDGRYQGEYLPMGTYYYVIRTHPDRKPYTGNITLIR